ncbi:GL24702 [Drosophila persimilis]|uniref:GL24702 n=1 Tax=Drosophila persimilis TaxID=7234 RepID=B4H633_DROPE|nr:uncharacterized protein LOC6601216 isoform X1 [Drosophila persimilis]XP_026848076.1 uncharacterized protein LOC6601216 isoform X1 [Drosophila persimilis]XP_026848078.1 uncharacterized protein LOC6601216 isoform X1 [Drosophila persimilis]EDW33250.1 GL24702 [Drosophila persimilis]
MADKRILLERCDSAETEKLVVHMAKGSRGMLHLTQSRSLPWSCLLRRKSLLGLLVTLIFCYFLIGRPEWVNVLDLDALHNDNYYTVRHYSEVPGMDVSVVDLVEDNENINFVPEGFLVYSNSCKIKEVDPYKAEVMRFFKRVKYVPCKKLPPLTSVKFNELSRSYVLSVNATAFGGYKVGTSINCCYMEVIRVNETEVAYSKCHRFIFKIVLPNTVEAIIVKCISDGEQIYINGHATIPIKEAVQQRLKDRVEKKKKLRPLSVLMLGIDSISRANLIRAMPKTAQYLYDNKWFELAGYNKVDDNTFPNIMALATGYDLQSAKKACSPYEVGGLEKCTFIWNLYQKHGYVTAYGEDATKINTFNYLKKGFVKPPVDYYLRPYLSAAEDKLDRTIVMGLPHCLGYETAAEHVYDYAMEFTRRFLNDTYFGFFWTNTHSHSDISQTSSMDAYMVRYLERLVRQGTMDNSVVVFFSDHGVRFGPTRTTWSGHLEERLPAMFIWLPTHLRRAHPKIAEALRLNRNRLTTPYDLHMTLKHILTLSGRTNGLESLGSAPSCPQCQSVLWPVPEQRSCTDVGIEDHWCTCWSYYKISTNSKQTRHMALRVVAHINAFVYGFRNGSVSKLCVPLSLASVQSAYQAHRNALDPENTRTVRLTFVTTPSNALFEATVRHNQTDDSMTVTGSVSRLNAYIGESDCIMDSAAKKYCFCRKKKTG